MPDKPLRDIRIMELGGYIAGPYATSLLCALGADVVKVEKPEAGDDFRRSQNDRSPYFIQYNAGKRSLAVDLKQPDGVRLVKHLVPRFDVVLENLRPGKLAALGLGPEECLALKPDLVYTSLTGFGEGGPLAGRPAYDTIGQAFGGTYSLLADEGAPQLSGVILGDVVTAISTALGVMAALVARDTSRQGQYLQTSIMEAISTVTIDNFTQYFEDGHRDPSRQSRHPQAQNFCVRTASGEYLAVHLSSSQKFWQGFARAIGRPELIDDPRFTTYNLRTAHYAELVPIVEPEFLRRTFQEWDKILTDHDVPFAPVLTIGGYADHPQTQWHELIEPESDGLSLMRPPWRFNGRRPVREAKAPRVGEHSREVATEVYDESRVAELVAAGILFTDS